MVPRSLPRLVRVLSVITDTPEEFVKTNMDEYRRIRDGKMEAPISRDSFLKFKNRLITLAFQERHELKKPQV